MIKKPIIWALLDDRTSNSNQTIGLANKLANFYSAINVEYNNLLIKLPNFILAPGLIGIKQANQLLPSNNSPDIVIATGRRLAPISLYIKKQHKEAKLIHIMSPDYQLTNFDLLILPTHDRKRAANIINIIGSFHHLTAKLLTDSASIWQNKFDRLPRPYLTVLIGGNSKIGKFNESHVNNLIDLINKRLQKTGGSALISTSRRTNQSIVNVIDDKLTVPNYIYSYLNSDENPYLGLLGLADEFIVTGDSVSMCSEACFTNKPIYIFAPDELTGNKQKIFHSELYTLKQAVKLQSIMDFQPYLSVNHLDETTRIANIIKGNYLSKLFNLV